MNENLPYPFEDVKMTVRQREAFRLACLGYDRHQIAAELGITWPTVYQRLKGALDKIALAGGKRYEIYQLPILMVKNLIEERGK
jgi:predicted transcriptional regulator